MMDPEIGPERHRNSRGFGSFPVTAFPSVLSIPPRSALSFCWSPSPGLLLPLFFDSPTQAIPWLCCFAWCHLDSAHELHFKALAASRFKGGRIGFSDLWCLPQPTGPKSVAMDPGSVPSDATRSPIQASRPKPAAWKPLQRKPRDDQEVGQSAL